MKTKLALAAALLVLAGTASGARWKPVSITPERALYIDMDALARKGDRVEAWDWQKFATAQTGASAQDTYIWVKSLTSYQCTERTTDALLKVYFGNDGGESRRTQLEGLQFPSAVEPGSVREKLLEMACNPPKPVIKPVAIVQAPAMDIGPPAPKSPEPATKPAATVPADKAAVNADPAKVDAKPAKAVEKLLTTVKESSVGPPSSAKPTVQVVQRPVRPPHSRSVRVAQKKKLAGGLKTAKSKTVKVKLRPDLRCPPPGPVIVSEPAPPLPQFPLTAGGGMFN